MEGWLKLGFFFTINDEFSDRVPPVSSLNSAQFSCWYRRIRNGEVSF